MPIRQLTTQSPATQRDRVVLVGQYDRRLIAAKSGSRVGEES